MERVMAELDVNYGFENATDPVEGAADTIKDCVGDVCEAVAGVVENITNAIHDEF